MVRLDQIICDIIIDKRHEIIWVNEEPRIVLKKRRVGGAW